MGRELWIQRRSDRWGSASLDDRARYWQHLHWGGWPFDPLKCSTSGAGRRRTQWQSRYPAKTSIAAPVAGFGHITGHDGWNCQWSQRVWTEDESLPLFVVPIPWPQLTHPRDLRWIGSGYKWRHIPGSCFPALLRRAMTHFSTRMSDTFFRF